jgi:hypothetical protein
VGTFLKKARKHGKLCIILKNLPGKVWTAFSFPSSPAYIALITVIWLFPDNTLPSA